MVKDTERQDMMEVFERLSGFLDTGAIDFGTTETALGDIATITEYLRSYEKILVAWQRERGKSWAEIGEALGMTKQAAWEKYRNVPLTNAERTVAFVARHGG